MKKLKLYGLYCFAIILALIGFGVIYMGFASGKLIGVIMIIPGSLFVTFSILIVKYKSIKVTDYVFSDWWQGPF
ncbi:hypothetical protein A3F65_03900 [Candidatus Saccharibacteria bacterium RIFCSPHIGHO2_12_FULL_47_16b]|nr:MAG: hypothetical protein A3F65_03900 [Candidatus Saccharibacteria bacterium RIFCSPHIGHO2_12_FULL_47_16b]OGL38894.1 MAG: hypothetical protein A3J32_01195 [Candidatus Saccharibacteria bacterium RIFCSPLOWO2_02_FULL_46_7]